MINGLTLIHLNKEGALSGTLASFEQNLTSIQALEGAQVFILSTCQRTILFGYDQAPLNILSRTAISLGLSDEYFLGECEVMRLKEAYSFLLEVLLGLKSQVLGEYEIVGQFRRAYQQFATFTNLDTRLLGTLEKLLKDAKEIRSKHLMSIGQQSYASIARKLCQSKLENKTKLLVVGSGDLARDFLRIAVKKFDVTLTARNSERGIELANSYGAQFQSFKNLQDLAAPFAGIVNTVGADGLTLFDQEFFALWESLSQGQRLFIDLGAPSSISSTFGTSKGLYRLSDIFKLGEVFERETKQKISAARSAAELLASKRAKGHIEQVQAEWKEFNFA